MTLLLFNSLANEALPIFLAELVPGYVAVALSVTMILVFGEIIPSAIFTGTELVTVVCGVLLCLHAHTPSRVKRTHTHCWSIFTGPRQVAIASRMSWLVVALMAFFCPIAQPIAWVLDNCLGKHGLKRYTREEVRVVSMRNIWARQFYSSSPANCLLGWFSTVVGVGRVAAGGGAAKDDRGEPHRGRQDAP